MKIDENTEQLLQNKLLEAVKLFDEIRDLSIALGRDYVYFLDGKIAFAVDGVPAAGGPRVVDEYWSASKMDCYPSDEEWEWIHGDNWQTIPKPYSE